MSWPLYESGFWAALLLGLLFGLALEGAGFGSARKLTAQFTLRDFAVFKVMFTAVLVAAAGLWALESAGVIGPRSVFIPTLYLWAIAAGGALIGTGFVIGGYCPGTCVVAVASGRLDALGFVAGMIAGVWAFAAGFDALRPFYLAAEGPAGQTLDRLLNVPEPVVLAVLIVIAAVGFWLGSLAEQRFGGPIRAEEVAGPRPGP